MPGKPGSPCGCSKNLEVILQSEPVADGLVVGRNAAGSRKKGVVRLPQRRSNLRTCANEWAARLGNGLCRARRGESHDNGHLGDAVGDDATGPGITAILVLGVTAILGI